MYKELIEVIVKMEQKVGGGGGCRGPIRGWELVRVARLGILGDVVYVGCQPRIEGIGQVGMTSLQVNCSQAEVNASVFIPVFNHFQT